ncbi:MAG: transketolase [Bavariicoccus seileri]|uniref:transketolase n=1 Tax=Bavariicoccus seileri TaxID=549685 RepID=UPI003F98BC86
MFDTIDQLAVNTVRSLSVEMVQAANSGHPGLPLGAAPMAYTLWSKYLKVSPKDPDWFNRDRFVLSAGHGSALLYSLLHLSGYKVSIDDIKSFRQLNSNTPGHPEVKHTDGVEATTGPLGQGIANAVGFAMAEAHLAATYNKPDFPIVDHHTFVLCGDGDLMEGISSEACSLAGTLKLGKLIMLYDSNDISLDGPLDKAFNEDIERRFKSIGWQYLRVEDGNDLDSIANAIEEAQNEVSKPTMIEVKTTIGFGSPNAGTHKVHGSPLGEEGIIKTKEALGWSYEDFFVPDEVKHRFEKLMIHSGHEEYLEWLQLVDDYEKNYPELAKAFRTSLRQELPDDLESKLPVYHVDDKELASRVSSQNAIQEIGKNLPNFWGGSADLSSSNNTMNKNSSDFSAEDYAGKNIWFGVREFAMGAALTGINLHGGLKTYAGTFFVFSDYLKAAIRVAAISQVPNIYVFTHDSVAVGEDGPTHEPIEQLAAFRATPNLDVIRPADGNEVNAAWLCALKATDHPTLLVLSRQGLPVLPHTDKWAYDGVEKGGYVLSPSESGEPHGILIATGSEVALAIDAQTALKEEGYDVSVVSLPSYSRFKKQSSDYIASVLPDTVRNRVSIEMGSSFGWGDIVGLDGRSIAIDTFGASGKGPEVVEHFGFTTKNIVKTYIEAYGK